MLGLSARLHQGPVTAAVLKRIPNFLLPTNCARQKLIVPVPEIKQSVISLPERYPNALGVGIINIWYHRRPAAAGDDVRDVAR